MASTDARDVLESAPVENPIRLGVVGLGHRAVHNVLRKTIDYDDYAPVAVCDVRSQLVEKVKADLAREFDLAVRGYTDFDEMLAKEDLDAVAVQTDADKQAPLICQALEAGCHVMAEVPLAYSIE